MQHEKKKTLAHLGCETRFATRIRARSVAIEPRAERGQPFSEAFVALPLALLPEIGELELGAQVAQLASDA